MCNVTLAAQYDSFISNELMVIATTMSQSEQKNSHVHYACINYLLICALFIVNRTIGRTHWLCCFISDQFICLPDMEQSFVL